MNEKYNGLCLKKTAYKDNGEMLTLFTLEKGLMGCSLIGAKKPDAKLRFSGEIFCFAEYVVSEKAGRRTVTEASEIDCFYGLRGDLDRFYAACSVGEFILGFTPDGENDYGLFLLTIGALKAIEIGANPLSSLVFFFVNALNEMGYLIDFEACSECGREIEGRAFFDFSDSVALCSECAKPGHVEMRIETFKLIKEVLSHDVEYFKNSDLSTYSPILSDKRSALNAIKFLNYYMSVNLGSGLKTVKTILENNAN